MRVHVPPNERERIQAEEVFRDEVRQEIEKQRPKHLRRRVWDFVNTSFGIWLLSSVVLGSLVWSWTLIQEYRHTKKAREELLTKVNYEIYRAFWAYDGLAEQSWNYEQYKYAHKKTLERPDYTLSDFKDATTEQLVWSMGEIPPIANKERAQKLLRIVESFRNDIWALKNLGNLSFQKKKEFDDHIRKALREQVGPLLYPGKSDAFVFSD
jgi:hypothetical protein